MARLLQQRLRRLREMKGFTQGQVAQYSGVSPSLISLMEKGERTNPSAESLSAIARTVGTTTDYLLGMTNDPRRPEHDLELTEVEQRILYSFRQLPPRFQRLAIRQLDLWLDHREDLQMDDEGVTDDKPQEEGS